MFIVHLWLAGTWVWTIHPKGLCYALVLEGKKQGLEQIHGKGGRKSTYNNSTHMPGAFDSSSLISITILWGNTIPFYRWGNLGSSELNNVQDHMVNDCPEKGCEFQLGQVLKPTSFLAYHTGQVIPSPSWSTGHHPKLLRGWGELWITAGILKVTWCQVHKLVLRAREASQRAKSPLFASSGRSRPFLSASEPVNCSVSSSESALCHLKGSVESRNLRNRVSINSYNVPI